MPSQSNTTLVSHFDCPGGGQVWVDGTTLYIAHMQAPHGTTVVDVLRVHRERLASGAIITIDDAAARVRILPVRRVTPDSK